MTNKPLHAGKAFWACWLVIYCFFIFPKNTQAQFLQEDFGQNRIQYKNFDWKYYNTQNFSVYYYAGGEETAKRTAEFAEKELKRITSLIGYYPYSRITLILYSSVTDLKQSNIGLNDERYETGGETFFIKNRIELAFEGTQVQFKRDLSYRVTELLLNDMMYGGSLKEVLRSTYLLSLPEWFISGAAAYIAEGWSVEMDNYMRDMIERTDGKKPEKVFYGNQMLAGQSIWNYIAERYGYTAIQNILNLSRITRDIEIGVSSSLNISFKRFLREWHNYYVRQNVLPESNLEWIDEEKEIARSKREDFVYSQPVFNPDGSRLAYVANDRGRYKVIVYHIAENKKRTIHKGGYKSPLQQTDFKLPVLAWKNNTILSIAEAYKGKSVLRTLPAPGTDKRSVGSRVANFPSALVSTVKRPFTGSDSRTIELPQFSQVLDMDYSSDGKTLVMSAVKNGQSDIYLLKANSAAAQQLTNDIFDDISPAFLLNSNQFVFSSNRWLDTTGRANNATVDKVVNNFDLFLYSPGRVNNPFKQLTFSLSNEVNPKAVSENEFVFLGEESGIRSVYKYDLAQNQAVRVTGFVQNIEDFSYHPASGLLAVSANKNRRAMYFYDNYPLQENMFPLKTYRQQVLEDRSARPVVQKSARKIVSPDSVVAPDSALIADTLESVNPENYEFETDRKEEKKKTVVAVKAPEQTFFVTGPYEYDLRFSVNNFVTSFYRDPLMGFGMVMEVGMSDLFENHRIRGAVFASISDIRTSRFYGEYVNLKKRYDLRISYKKESIYAQQELLNLRFGRHELKPTISFPLTHALSVKAIPTFVSTRFSVINNFAFPDLVTDFLGGGGEVVYDNSIATGINQLEGTRMKAGIMKLNGIGNPDESFGKVYVDARHYQKIHKQIIWAHRGAYTSFFGNSPKPIMLGGMDNWLNPRDSDAEPVFINNSADLFYLQYATNMRGFHYNARNGTKLLLYNTELRIPIVQYLMRQPVSSGFFRNLQLIGFSDIGTAYSGSNPFSRNNSFNRQIVGEEKDPFRAVVYNYRNPFLFGYGLGARTTLLGVYGKLDVAWGEENYQKTGPRFYLTLGYDF